MISKIQKQILSKLLKTNGLRYRDAHPQFVENDLYNYHLQFLVNKKYINKRNDRYYLSEKGKQFVQQMDVQGEIKEYFKFSVLLYAVKINKGKKEILLQKRLRHPYYGDIGTISGKVHVGEKVEVAAKRKMLEEAGLEAKFKLIGLIRKIRRDKRSNIIEDTLYHVCYCETPSGKLIKKNKSGENFWCDFKDAVNYQKKNITASKKSEEIFKRIQRGEVDLFYFYEDIILNRY